DHLGHPDPSEGIDGAEFRRLLELNRYDNVFLKASGFHHFSRCGFPFDDCHALLRAAYDAFGPKRILWGSDYPHVLVSGGYAHSLAVLRAALPQVGEGERELILRENATALYWPR